MSNQERGDLESLMRMALAAGSGLVDETAYGLLEKNSDFVKELRKENPASFTAGQVGSYFVPGTGILGNARLIGKGLGLGGRAAKAASSPAGVSMLKKLLLSIGKGAATGAIEGGGQTAVRGALGTSKDSVADSAKSGGTGGAILGMLSPVAGKAASKIYSHPSIFNPKSPKSPELMEKLMNEGVWGGEGTFRKYSRDAKKKYNTLMDPMRKKIEKMRATADDIVGVDPKTGKGRENSFAEREWNKKTVGSNAVGQFDKTRQGMKDRLGNNPSMKKVQEYQKVLNEELATLAPQKRAEAISGVGGNANNEDQALGAMKASIEALEKRMIAKKFGQAGLDKVKAAKDSYGTSRELERALNRPESLTQAVRNVTPIPAAAGGLTALGSLVAGATNPAILALSGMATAATAAGRSLPGRTGLGVMANKFGRDPSKVISGVSRATEMAGRDETGKTYESIPLGDDGDVLPPTQKEDPFSQYVPKIQAAKQKETVPEFKTLPDISDGNPRKKSRGNLGLTKKQLEEIRQMDAGSPKNTEDNAENPFLQYVPSR